MFRTTPRALQPRKHILITGPPGIGKTTIVKQLIQLFHEDNARTKKKMPAPVVMSGFYTKEVRNSQGDERIGFDIVRFDGKTGMLARTGECNVGLANPRVGRYYVNIPEFEEIAVPMIALPSTLSDATATQDANTATTAGATTTTTTIATNNNNNNSSSNEPIYLIFIDEIGKMECLSHAFTNAVRKLLEDLVPPPPPPSSSPSSPSSSSSSSGPTTTRPRALLVATVAEKGDSGLIKAIKSRSDITMYMVTLKNRAKMAEAIRKDIWSQFGVKL